LTEDDLIAAIAQALGEPARKLVTGIGDDAAAWHPKGRHVALMTTDMLVDGVHFRFHRTAPGQLGRKALAENLSDIAAMGGRPSVAVVALGVTPQLDEAWVRDFYRGMAPLAASAGCAIAGGDIARAPALVISIAVAGEARRSSLRLRSGARPGDLAVVTGALGLAAAGLHFVDAGAHDAAKSRAVRAYLTPQPRLREGLFFGSRRAVHAVMDVSDGISTDLARMVRASKCSAVVEAARIYVHPDVAGAAQQMGRDALDLALSGGDDYELLAAIDARSFEHVAHAFRGRFGRPLAAIGRFEAGSGEVWIECDGKREPLPARGYDHLR
ncbi:MAG TPA: thiamine-phosphate kinase, partial [Candidatus Eremiobacteraceae bacterium]|nr:thiamine-phosphate kinase [Candidatus Eremiobacteraceae bacterium]